MSGRGWVTSGETSTKMEQLIYKYEYTYTRNIQISLFWKLYLWFAAYIFSLETINQEISYTVPIYVPSLYPITHVPL